MHNSQESEGLHLTDVAARQHSIKQRGDHKRHCRLRVLWIKGQGPTTLGELRATAHSKPGKSAFYVPLSPACMPATESHVVIISCSLLSSCTSKVRCPLPSRGASASAGAARVGEPFAEEAKAFTRKNLMHRQVRVLLLIAHILVN